MTTPEEVEVARRNLIAELKGIGGRSRNNQGLYEVDARTLADLIEVLEASQAARPTCDAVLSRRNARCVFTPGHHTGEDWTPHGDQSGWTWNDQPAEEES